MERKPATHEDLAGKLTVGSSRTSQLHPVHGTASAGLAAAITNNGKGIAGVNWGTSILSYEPGKIENKTINGVPYTFYTLNKSAVSADVNSAVSAGATILLTPIVMVRNPEQYSVNPLFRLTPDLQPPLWNEFIFIFGAGKGILSIATGESMDHDNAILAFKNAYLQGRTVVAAAGDFEGSIAGVPPLLSHDRIAITVGSTRCSALT